MAKIQSSIYGVFFVFSVILNLYCFINLHYVGGGVGGKGKQLSWTQKAAEEAEAVAAVSCSGHGRAYLDGFSVDGKPICECNTCFGGPDCSAILPCFGDPLFLEPFWMEHAASSALVVVGWHRMSYTFNDHSFISRNLENHIRKYTPLPRTLLQMEVYALSPENSSSPARVVASIPYFPLYGTQTDYFNSVNFEFEGDASSWMNTTSSDSSSNVIEFVTSPNNPDGLLKKPTIQGSTVKAIYDHAYYWPHFTPIPAPADGDLMIFTISKLTGHAGSRFGWAVVKDEGVYQRMMTYMSLSEMGVSRDTQLRALKLLKAVVQEGNGKEIFDFAYKTMRNRWEKLRQVISMSKRFSIEESPPQFCIFSQKVRGSTPAYAWVKCERKEDKDCTAVLRAANIIGREGSRFAAGDCHVRLSLLKSQDDFDQLIHRLSNLISEEDGTSKLCEEDHNNQHFVDYYKYYCCI
ncbi:hypothetical protein HYC85_020199 [Camellia sinensis]|uniref:Alliinase C-terminal domain-containing protein n=1 Tax=Camellia sinensis TaxID=4442 RepID=A0A7J7GPZ4_CAMSI|nr:hypothetical protein HYC85_020199 [Camellia sinensis]